MSSPVVVTRIQIRRGIQSQFDALYPPGYNGIGGYGSIIGFDATNFPDVLLSGEMCFVTDTRNTYIGNINAEYTQINIPVVSPPQYELFSAAAAQTIFNTTIPVAANAAGFAYLQVFVNGVKQVEGVAFSYQVTGPNQITFNVGLTLADDVEIYAFL